jgi:hypothetical protein
MLIRNQQEFEKIKQETLQYKKDFLWVHPDNILPEIPLYLLRTGEVAELSELASQVSCFQHIVSNGAFCCSMFVDLLTLLEQKDSLYKYRKVHYECGSIGQVLYNEAWAMGLKATGLGCFIDDTPLDNFGLGNGKFRVSCRRNIGDRH